MKNSRCPRVCTRGQASVNTQTKLRLFADSAGYCQNPACEQPLFSDQRNADFHYAEIAHIIASSDLGPRAKPNLNSASRGDYNNLILLCPNCHTKVDKDPANHPDVLLTKWKSEHICGIRGLFGVTCESRADARAKIVPIIAANRQIHALYGPDREYRLNPEAEEADVWKRKVVSQVIPNNYRILHVLDANRKYLSDEEQVTLEVFRQHVDDLAARHIDNDDSVGRRFPGSLGNIMK